jgi:hypothetical protein
VIDRDRFAAACKLDTKHLDSLIALKRLAGRSSLDILLDLERMSWLNAYKPLITAKKDALVLVPEAPIVLIETPKEITNANVE